jgi:hypothetical protein
MGEDGLFFTIGQIAHNDLGCLRTQ